MHDKFLFSHFVHNITTMTPPIAAEDIPPSPTSTPLDFTVAQALQETAALVDRLIAVQGKNFRLSPYSHCGFDRQVIAACPPHMMVGRQFIHRGTITENSGNLPLACTELVTTQASFQADALESPNIFLERFHRKTIDQCLAPAWKLRYGQGSDGHASLHAT